MHHTLEQRISDLVASRELKFWYPQVRTDPIRRRLYVSAEIDDEFDEDTWVDSSMVQRYAHLAADFDRFVCGDMIPVGMQPYDKGDDAFMARVDPAKYGIWTIRSRAPRPAIRVFGGFLEPDLFVALISRRRQALAGPESREWKSAREDSIAKWKDLFPYHAPITGDKVSDFITKKTLAV